MKRNGMCPICFLKQLFTKPETVTELYNVPEYSNGVALTPPMGWSSWNTFKNHNDEDLIYETAVAMKEKGLLAAGYQYVNLDDNWHSSLRDKDGNLQGDLTAFAHGIPELVKKVNALGLKVGIYSSNGTLTCEDLPAGLYNERRDALTFARWGVEYFKYDFCHNIPIASYAPWVYGITVSKLGERNGKFYNCTEAKLFGLARFMTDKYVPGGKYVGGLDRNTGAMQYDNVVADEDGEYVLTVDIRKHGRYEKHLMAIINGAENYQIPFPAQWPWNVTARFQVVVNLKKGLNTVRLFNPIGNRADSAMLQYQYMGKMLIEATKQVALETQSPEKPIVFSLCEWGKNRPWDWGATAGNLWRTTGDIRPNWKWMIEYMYRVNVTKYERASVGHWNDPDMLEVGNGKLTYDENVSHFSLWCMMASPLILGNDLRTMPDNVLQIITNKNLIAIDQDALGKQAKRVVKGTVDILARPLADGTVAVCFFNKGKKATNVSFPLKTLVADTYVSLKSAQKYAVTDMWTDEASVCEGTLSASVASHGVKVFNIKA